MPYPNRVRPGGTPLLPFLVATAIGAVGISGCDGGAQDREGEGGARISATILCAPVAGVAPVDVECEGGFEGPEEESPPVRFDWIFGDAGEGEAPTTGRTARHRYNRPGEFTITLTVTLFDAAGEEEATAEATAGISVRGAPDLLTTGVSHTPQAVDSGDDITVTFTVKNGGSSAAANTQACVVLGRDRDVSLDTAVALDNRSFVAVGGLDAQGESAHEAVVVGVPANTLTGTYFVAVCADCNNDVDEGQDHEGDNCATSEGPPLAVSRSEQFPDLSAAEASATPSSVFEQGAVHVCFLAKNTGERAVLTPAWRIHLAPGEGALPGAIAAGAAIALRDGQLEVLRAEDEERVCTEIVLPPEVVVGGYTLLVQMDPDDAVRELSEADNVAVGAQSIEVIERVVDGVDLFPCAIDAEPHQVASDGNVQVTACVCNRGRVRAAPHIYSFVVAPDPAFDAAGARTLANCNISQLPAQECRTCTIQANMAGVLPPGTLGRFFVCGRTDASLAIRETLEDNNDICDPEPITVGESAEVDLRPTAVSFGPLLEDPHPCGRELDWSVTVENTTPTRAGAFEIGLYLSPDDTLERSDFLLDRIPVGQLSGSRTITGQVVIPRDVPRAVERWYFGAIVDPERTVEETDEGNNRAFSPDRLGVAGCHGGCTDDGFEPNDAVGFAARIGVGTHENLCVGPESGEDWFGVPMLAGESLTVTIGFDQIEGDLDLELYDASGVNLLDRSASGASQEVVRVPLATAPALYFVRVMPVRPEVENGYTLVLDVRPPLRGVDLAVGNVQVAPRAAILGQDVAVQLDVLNLGMSDAAGPIEVALVALKAGAFVQVDDPADPDCPGGPEGEPDGVCGQVPGEDEEGRPIPVGFALGTVEVEGVRALGAAQVRTTVVLPPAGGEGTFVVVARLDPGNAVAEEDEDNNEGVSPPITHAVPPQACQDNEDPFEPNNGPGTAQAPPDFPAPNGDRTVTDNLAVCEGFDDYWVYDLLEGDELTCDVSFLHEDGDLDLYLLGPDGQIRTQSTTSANREEVSVSGAEAGRWVLWVSFAGGGGDEPWNLYRLRCELNRCTPDAFEAGAGNNDCASAAALTADGVDGASLCTADRDWYCIALFAGFPVTICGVPDSGAASDLSLTVLRGCGEFVQNRTGCVQFQPRFDDTYCVQVEERRGRIKGYDLTVAGLDGADVAVSDLAVAPLEVLPSDRPQVTATIRNTLVEPADAFTYEIRLSRDAVLDDADTLLGQWRRDVPLPRGQRVVIDTKVDLPADIEAGGWFLGVRVLPDQPAGDRSRQNNQRSAPLTVVAACEPDDRDPGDDAAPGEPAGPGVHAGAICAGDEDWYAVELGARHTLTALLRAPFAAGDLDLWVYRWVDEDAGGSELLARSETAGDSERIVLAAPGAGTYLVRVLAGRRGHQNTYTLELTVQ